ncbi:MAG: hypothetical protein U1E89_21610 [Burkholderiaceae bacterium]
MSTATRRIRHAALAVLLFGAAAGITLAQTNKVFRCTGANGKVTLSDRRCPDEDPAAQASAKAEAKPAAGPASKAEGQAAPEPRATTGSTPKPSRPA